jgi:serine/threonine protein kinase
MADSDQKWWINPADLKWIKILGEGAFGVVRKCHWSHGGIRAVKLFKHLSPSGIELQRKVLNRILDQSRILLPVGYGISSAGHHIIMTPFAKYGDLQAILESKPILPLPRRIQMAVEIAEGETLQAASPRCSLIQCYCTIPIPAPGRKAHATENRD